MSRSDGPENKRTGAPPSAFGRASRAIQSGWATLDGSLRSERHAEQHGNRVGSDSTRANVEAALAALLSGQRRQSKTEPHGDQPSTHASEPRGTAGLVRGGVHEWFGTSPSSLDSFDQDGFDQDGLGRDGFGQDGHQGEHSDWSPPLLLLSHLAARAVRDALERGAAAHVLWIGRSVWPYPHTLMDDTEIVEVPSRPTSDTSNGLLQFTLKLHEPSGFANGTESALFSRSVFVDPGKKSPQKREPARGVKHPRGVKSASETLWAIDTGLRCPSITAIVADGTGLGMAATRRLQLVAAEANVFLLLARPPHEIGEVSAATTRWVVTRDATEHPAGEALQWNIKLLRAKGAQVLLRTTAPIAAALQSAHAHHSHLIPHERGTRHEPRTWHGQLHGPWVTGG